MEENQCFPFWKRHYHDYTELNNRLKGENLQLNIGLYQGAVSGSLLAFVCKRMLSKIISKLKGINKGNNEQKKEIGTKKRV